MAHTVFICYAQSDKDIADKVCSTLESRGIKCWIAPRDVLVAKPYAHAIVEAISTAKVMVLVLSSAANASKQVMREVETAASKGITIVPLLVEDVRLTEALEFFISSFHWLDATKKPLEECLERLAENIERLVSMLPESPKPERGERAPRDARALYNKGASLYALGRYEEAMGCFDRALEIAQRDAQAWTIKGLSLAHLGRHEEALSCLDKAKALGEIGDARAVAPLIQALKEEDRSAVPGGMVDRLHFTVTSPPMVQLGTSFVIDVWAHLERQRKAVIQRVREAVAKGEISIKTKGPVQVARGTVLTVRLKLERLIVEDPEDTILWDGGIGSASFPVRVPNDAAEGPSRGLATFHVDGLQIARVYFVIQVGRTSLSVDHIPTQEERHCKAFACYASADREEVFPRLHGIQKATPQLEIFLDVLSLRSGQNWEQELWKVIPSSDVFYLFWSDNARRSEWVEKEWRCALKTRGIDFIDPFPLVSPEEVPPPPELASKHFNDLWLALMRK